jgi:8-oxo-dGTP pyrophosphatase MutT (NUDIX family)
MTTLASGIILYRRVPSARLLLLRSRDNGHWGFAKGRRDAADAHEVHTALREVQEETGYTGLVLHARFRAELSYVVRDPRNPYPKRVVYFLAEAPAREPSLSPEHDLATWAAPDEVERLLVHGQMRDLARAAFAALAGP